MLYAILPGPQNSAQAQGLQISYGSKGVQTIAFQGITLEDVGAHSGDAFHIWHMKSADLSGNVIPGWGENNTGETWNASTNTETYTYSWGAISTQFIQQGATLNMIVTETNNAGSGIIFDGAEIYPFALHFPADPAGFYGYTQYAITTTGPGVSPADYGSGMVTSVLPDESLPMYVGWKNQGNATYSPLMTTTSPDGLATFLPHLDRPVQPGSSLTFTVSLRFTPSGVPASATDAYSSFAATYPSQMTWTDKRVLGTAYLASSPAGGGDSSQPGGFPTNPRRYFNDAGVDVTNSAGLQAFQNRMLAQAAANVTNTQALNGQGVITWDIEGEQFPQETSYVCSPDQIATIAPEMESIISDSSSPYYGQKLDDAYFRSMSVAGLRIGLCLRPQVFTLSSNGTASQSFLSTNAAIVANLETKARYANSRWGATIFYVDSTVDLNGGTLDPAIFQQLITDLPSFLFIPEESTPRYYAYSAPFYSFIFHTTTGTPSFIYNVYPKAFGANLINDVSASTLATYEPQLIQAVAAGDILMGHADYWQANDPTLVSIYQAAGASPVAPIQVTPTLTWPLAAAITYGTPLSAAQLNASASTTGSFVYLPASGTILPAGANALLTTFNPTDTRDYKSATASVVLNVAQATPVLSWSTPATLSAGSTLTASQLNATANVPGTFTYSPGPGTIVNAGTLLLTATFSPADAADYASASVSTSLTVTSAGRTTPTITWPTPASILYGTALGAAQLNATTSVPGSFSFLPGAGTVLQAGVQPLTAIFTPADLTGYTPATSSVSLTITPATPQINWSTPLPIPYGTQLDGAQLNASSNVPGTFAYSPGFGVVLPSGSQSLTATFIPGDSRNYSSVVSSVLLTVNPAAPTSPTSRLSILSPSPGATVSGSILVSAQCSLALDAAGTFLLVDGVFTDQRAQGPFVYPLNTTTLSNGTHNLQLWGHDIGNNTTLSTVVMITVAN